MERKKAVLTILISNKLEFKTKDTVRDKKEYYVIIKGTIKQENTIGNIYAHNIRTPKQVKQILMDITGEIDSNKVIVNNKKMAALNEH